MTSSEIQAFYILLVLVLALPISLAMGSSWASKNPDKMPFKWGYFQSLCGILGFIIAALALIGLFENEKDGALQFLCAIGIAYGITGIFMFRRNRWWWIVGILITLNPVLWIANGIYLSNRWREMRSQVCAKARERKRKRVLPPLLFLLQQGKESGPYHRDQIITKWNASEITADALFRESVELEWTQLLPYIASFKTPWTFGWIVKKSLLVLLGLIALWIGTALVVGGYDLWERRPKIQNSLGGFALGENLDEILFIHGEPKKKEENKWIYHINDWNGYSHSFFVFFNKGNVESVACDGGAPDLLGFSSGSAYADVLDRLGNPSKIINSEDKLQRIIFYDRLNAFYGFRQAELKIYGIYDSEKGLPDIFPNWAPN